MAFQFESKEMQATPSLYSQCCWSVHSKVVRIGKSANSKQRKATPTQALHFNVKFMYMPCQFSIYVVYFLNILYGLVWSNIRISLDAEKAEKLMKIYRLYRAEKEYEQNLLKLYKLFFSFFEVLHISLLLFLFH